MKMLPVVCGEDEMHVAVIVLQLGQQRLPRQCNCVSDAGCMRPLCRCFITINQRKCNLTQVLQDVFYFLDV